MNTSLLQKSLETAAEDIACEPPERWSVWVIYLVLALASKTTNADSIRGFLGRLQQDLAQHFPPIGE